MEEIAIKKALDILENEELVSLLVDRLYILQGEENPRLPRLNEQLADIEKRIGNMLSAIEQGIITDSTKDRLAQLEEKKKEIEITILQEKIKKPFLTKEQILFGIEKYKKLDLSTREGKQRLIDDFINAIYVYDDRITFTYNYKDGTETITLSELESAKSSDIKCVGAPKKTSPNGDVFFWCRDENHTRRKRWEEKEENIGCRFVLEELCAQRKPPEGAFLLYIRESNLPLSLFLR